MAEQLRARVYNGCPHTPRCTTAADCVALIAQHVHEEAQA